MANENDQVIEDEVEEVSEETPSDEGVSNQETPGKSEIDVESLKADWEAKLQKTTDDLNKMKSTFQKREAELQAKYQQEQAELRRQLNETRLQGMDADQRKKYEEQMKMEELQRLQSEQSSLSAKLQEQAQILDAVQFFVQRGVPYDQLIVNQGYNTLTQSGWDWIDGELKRLRDAQTTAKPESPRKPAPSVVTDKASPSTGTTWAQLRKQYGSEENVYQMIEQGLLDPSILPK